MSKVHFSKDLSATPDLFTAAGLNALIAPDNEVALKIHFGEPGNTAFLKPERVRPIADLITKLGGKPFYTDCNTLYNGPRGQTGSHLQVARDHGFTLEQAGADAVVPDDDDQLAVDVGLKHFKQVYLGGLAARTGTLIALTHFKGHEMTGFGGVLKNLGMGMGTRLGKLKMHQDCRECPQAKTCRKNKTIEACWVGKPAPVQEKIVEYAYGALKSKKSGFINFITDVSPNCDCYSHNEPPIVPDIGILASLDPVAIDQASVDLVNRSAGRDIFRELYPDVDWEIQLAYAEKTGLGSRQYELVLK